MSEVATTKRKAEELGEAEVQEKKRVKQVDAPEGAVEENGNGGGGNESDEDEEGTMEKELAYLVKGGDEVIERRTRGVHVDYSKLDSEYQDGDDEDEDDEDEDDEEHHDEGDEAAVQVPNGDKKLVAEEEEGDNDGDAAEEVKVVDEASEDEKDKEKGGYEEDEEGNL